MASGAKTAYDCRYWAEAAKYYEEAVRANERSGSRRRNWRSTRSGYYGYMATAHSRLGNTDAAIDAASAAVVIFLPGADASLRQIVEGGCSVGRREVLTRRSHQVAGRPRSAFALDQFDQLPALLGFVGFVQHRVHSPGLVAEPSRQADACSDAHHVDRIGVL